MPFIKSSNSAVYDHLERVFNTIQFIEKNLLETLNIGTLAKTACYAPFHYQRVFREITGLNLIEYVRKRKLTFAAHSILSHSGNMTEIGCKLGFETQSSFGRAFKSQYGVSPLLYKANGKNIWYNDTEVLKDRQIEYMSTGGVTLLPEIVFEPRKVLYGIKFEQFSGQKTNREKRHELRALFESFNLRIDKLYQVEFSNDFDVLSKKAIGYIAVNFEKRFLPEALLNQLHEFEIPEGTVARFTRRITDDYWAQRYIFENWTRKTDHLPTYAFVYYEKQLGSGPVTTDTISIPIQLRLTR